MSGVIAKIDKFTWRNSFSLWQIKMRALLKQQGLWAPLTTKKTADPENAEMAVLEEKAHSSIMLCLDDIITEVAEEKTAAGLWLKLESLYQTKSSTNKLLLKQRMFSLRMQEGQQLREHLDHTILLELRNIDVKIDDEDAALILLVFLPLSYENFIQSFIGGKDTVTLEEVRSSLHTRELRHKAAGTDNQASHAAGLVASDNKSEKKKKFKKSGSKGPKPSDICNYCKETGHWKNDCPKKKKQKTDTGTAVVAEEGDANSEKDIALVADGQTHHNDVWVLDSGASYHICPHREWFATYEQVDGGSISMANSSI